jgi:hypothetical protein
MGRPLISLEGKRFGRIVVLHRDCDAPSGSAIHPKWICICDCGNTISMFGTNITKAESCGCERHKALLVRNTKHGMFGTKAYANHMSNLRRSRKICATPKWANLAKIRKIYAECPEGYEVDHIVPLAGRTVCGLHVEHNLQYLTPRENQAKKNKWSDHA